MASLRDIATSIRDLPYSEALALVVRIRNSRQINKKNILEVAAPKKTSTATTKKRAAPKGKPIDQANAAIAQMTPDAIRRLLEGMK